MAEQMPRVDRNESLGGTMRAWAIEAYGEPMRLMNLPIPQPRQGDVLIRMHAAEVGDWDDLVRAGGWPMERPFPLILGLGGAGVAAVVGKDVTRFSETDSVYAYSYPLYDNGAWAEYMLVPESYVAAAPTSVDLTHAGAVPIVGLTAHETLTDILRVQRGDVVLITAAAGGVGHIAVQIAAQLEAHVVATAGKRNQEFVRSLGAEAVIDYTAEDLVSAIRAHYPRGVDKALNGVADEAANDVVQTLRDGGHVVDLTGTASVRRPGVRVDTDYVVKGDGNRLSRLARMIDDGRLKIVIQEVFPFERAPEAVKVVQAKHVRGKVALQIA